MATSTASSAPQDPLLGKAVGGRYVIERLIGRGGVGLVYLAEDRLDGSKVVVKVLAPHWAEDRDAVARFDREALRMAELHHPNVVEMYDHGHFEGRAYIVMEFIRGEPLRRYLGRRKRLPLEEFVPIAAQILAGAGYVHERGIMLRDIKPPNIMLCEHGGRSNHVKLLDFGLAKLIEEDDDDEVTKAHVIGTAAYMSPEQIKGERIDVRVDVYALGVLFFLMLTGEQPIAGDNDAAVLVNHVHGVPKPLAERLPQGHRIPRELVALVESCLAKQPDDRPADAGAMARRLREILPAPLFELPSANLKSRAPAETYWAARLHTGPAAVAALESDTNDSAEWTRPLLRRAAKSGESPLRLAEAEIAAQKQAKARTSAGSGALPPPMPPPKQGSGVRPLPSTGSGVRPLPSTGSGVRPLPSTGSGVRPLPRATTGPGAAARPKPPPPPPPARARAAAPPSPTLLESSPGASTIRVTAADAKEAVARLEEELEASRSSMRAPIPAALPSSGTSEDDVLGDRPTLVPTKAPAATAAAHDLDAEASDALPIALDDDDASRPSEAIAPTLQSDPVATEALSVMRPMPLPPTPPPRADGMRWGALVAIGGLLALVLGGLTAWLVLGGDDAPSVPVASPTAAGDATPASTHAAASGAGAGQTPPASTSGRVEIRAVAGARVEVDGEDRGEAPVPLDLPVGEHRVRVTAPGHHPWQTTIDVKAGANAAVTAELVPVDTVVVVPSSKAEDAGGARPRPKPATSKPKAEPKAADTKPGPTKPEPTKPAPTKPKPDVFMDPSKGKDDGIFLPVGGK